MSNFKIYFFLLSLIFISSCAKKATPTSSKTDKYDENLEEYRPKYEIKSSLEAPSNNRHPVNVAPKEFDNKALEEKLSLIKEKNKSIKYTQGYRIQIYSGSNQEAAEKAKESIYRIDAKLSPEIIYLQPIFKVKVGNYYDRLEAQATYKKLKQTFPQALLVPERVSIK